MPLRNKFFILIFALLVFFFPLISLAGVIPCGLNSDDPGLVGDQTIPCTTCHLIVGTFNIFDWSLKILITVAVVAIFISGVIYIVSAGSEQMVTMAKNYLKSSLIGFTLVLMGWFLVNITMWIVTAKTDLGVGLEKWNKFNCSIISSTGEGGGPNLPPSQPGGLPGPGGGIPDNMGYTYQGNIEQQKPDASAQLTKLLGCMQGELPAAAKEISSISDSAGINKCYRDNWTNAACAHSQFSCHYGGRTCPPKSYAVDFGKEDYAPQIISAANKCGAGLAQAEPASNPNHVHVSVGQACGCDY